MAENGKIPLLLIHGAWLSARSWENYIDYFGRRGFAVSAPEWPRKQGDVEEMRRTADDSAGLGVQEIVDHYVALIDELEQPPVLIGHSYGGLFVELLLDRGLGRAGVAMSPAPPKGILALPFSTLKAGAPALAHPSKWHGVVTLSPEEFTYAFVNTFAAKQAGKLPPHTNATPFPRPGRSSTRPGLQTSTCTRRPRSSSETRTASRC